MIKIYRQNCPPDMVLWRWQPSLSICKKLNEFHSTNWCIWNLINKSELVSHVMQLQYFIWIISFLLFIFFINRSMINRTATWQQFCMFQFIELMTSFGYRIIIRIDIFHVSHFEFRVFCISITRKTSFFIYIYIFIFIHGNFESIASHM